MRLSLAAEHTTRLIVVSGVIGPKNLCSTPMFRLQTYMWNFVHSTLLLVTWSVPLALLVCRPAGRRAAVIPSGPHDSSILSAYCLPVADPHATKNDVCGESHVQSVRRHVPLSRPRRCPGAALQPALDLSARSVRRYVGHGGSGTDTISTCVAD